MNRAFWTGTRRSLLRYAPATGLTTLLRPPSVLARARPDNTEAEVDRYLGARMRKLRIPGLALAVVREGHVVLARNYGTASVEFAQPVRADTVFAVNSITKAFTGIAAMRLVEQGRLELIAPVGRYLADLPQAWRDVTIRQLLSHMSGLPDIMCAPTVETDAAAAWAWVLEQPTIFAPGARFHYCQTNYTLIQRVLNTLENRALDAPLALDQIRLAGMKHTAYGDANDVIPHRAPTYRWAAAAPFIDGYCAAASDAPRELKAASERFLPFRRASSGLNSTALDMAAWLAAIDRGTFLSVAARETMWTPTAFENGEKGQWGLGWQVFARGSQRAVAMTGGGRAAVFYYPENRLGIVILTNLSGSYPEDMVDKVASLFAPALDLSGIPALRIELEERGYHRAALAAADVEARGLAFSWPEMELNDWGYRLLSTGRASDALDIFKLAAAKFPASANAHDSLAQAYRVKGDIPSSIAAYKRVLVLDPANEGARRKLAELERP
ncbi:serine hydrolase [Sphingopyxis fribergensis]